MLDLSCKSFLVKPMMVMLLNIIPVIAQESIDVLTLSGRFGFRQTY